MGAAAAAYSPPAPWPERVWRAAGAFSEWIAAHPDYVRLDFVESYAAGPTAIRRSHQNKLSFALFLEEGYQQSPAAARLPRRCSEAIACAVFGLMRKLAVEGRIERMLSLLPAAVYTVLAPFIGPSEAAARVRTWARAAS